MPITSAIAVDGNNYSYLGYGIHMPTYEKRAWLDYDGCLLSQTNFDSLTDNMLSLFTFMRHEIIGGPFFSENSSETFNYQVNNQAKYLSRLNYRLGNLEYMVTPYSAPSQCLTDGFQATMVPSELVYPRSSTSMQTQKAFIDTTASWQAYLESISDGINKMIQNGCNVQYFTTPNECSVTGPANFWICGLSPAMYVKFIYKIWLGQGLSGGGIKSRFPWLKLVAGSSESLSTYLPVLAADSTANAQVTWYDQHEYSDGAPATISPTNYAAACGIGNAQQDHFMLCEMGPIGYGSSYTTDNAFQVAHNAHSYGTYCRPRAMFAWTSLRDIANLGTQQLGGTYLAPALADLNSAAGTFTLNKYYYALYPYLKAAGKTGCSILTPSTNTIPGTNSTTFDPATNLYVDMYIRNDDGKYCTVVANRSSSSQTITLNYTKSGSAYTTSGNRTDVSVSASTITANGTVSTTAGAITITVPATTITLLELS